MQTDEPAHDDATVTFYRVYPEAIPPMRADKSALGVLPTMAYRHCEPVRTASAFGWYVFPPEDICLKWNGADAFHLQDGAWQPLSTAYLPGFSDYWDAHAPHHLQGLAPPLLTQLPVRGLVQVWSGLLCATRPDWSVLVRAPVNMRGSNLYSCFEGVVEADRFRPFPLFINIQLIAVDMPITLARMAPLFQVQPLMRATYSEDAHRCTERAGLGMQTDGQPALNAADWDGYRKTIRVEAPDAIPESGQYSAATRRRGKHESSAI